jgi:Secretion system C-terminal sorting domain
MFSFFPAIYQGWSVGLSADGNTAIVGGYYDNHAVGAAWVYKRTSGVWSQVGSKLEGGGAQYGQQGYSVAISGDGNTAVVGANNDSPYYGSAFVYVWNGSTWVEQGNKLVGGNNSAFGSAVALSSDGNTLIVGGSGDYNYASVGAIWIFNRMPDSSWVLMENEIRPSDYTAGTPSIGCSVSLSSDGSTAIVGGLGDHSYDGAAWIFKRSISTDTVWNQIGTKLIGTDTVGASRMGGSVAISGDGNTVIVGGYGDSSYAGATWVYATPSAPLPVELTSFTASPNRLIAELHWTTATEINNAEFEVEQRPLRSPPLTGDGTEQWHRVGSVAGAGTSNSPKSYSFVDKVGGAGTYSYRLKQIDRNGAFKFSQEIQVQLGAAPKVFELSQNFPNPFNPTTTIEFSVPSDGHATLKVYNTIGQQVETLFDGAATAGEYHQATFDASRLASGVYFAQLRFGNGMQMKKLLLVK